MKTILPNGDPLWNTGYQNWHNENFFRDELFYGRKTTKKRYNLGDLSNTEKISEKTIILPTTELISPAPKLMEEFSNAFRKIKNQINLL